MYVSGLGKVDNRICIVLEWTPEEASLLLLWQSAAASVYISREHGRLRTTFCMRLVLVSFSCMFIIIETLHDHLKSLRDAKPPVLGTRGPRDRSHDVSVYETCACVIINLLSYVHVFARGTCAS